MRLFSRNSGNGTSEKTYEENGYENGYIIGVDSHVIYHVPKIQTGSIYIS